MNWKQKLAEHYDYKCFKDMGYLDRYFAEKAVELYQKELNEKLKNVGLSISELVEEKEPEKSKPSWVEQNSDFIQEALDG